MITSFKTERKFSLSGKNDDEMGAIDKLAFYGTYQIGSVLFTFATYLTPDEFKEFDAFCQKIEARVKKAALEEARIPTPNPGSALEHGGGC